MIEVCSLRPLQTRRAWLRGKLQNINFFFFGYTTFRIKRWLGIRQVPLVHVGEGKRDKG